MSDTNKRLDSVRAAHLIWLCIVIAILYFNHRDMKAIRSQVANVRREVESIKSSAEKLKEIIDDFDSEDWKDVVPSVRGAAKELVDLSESTDTAVSDLEEATEETDYSDP